MGHRILFWSELFWPTIGGVEITAAKLLPALQARGYEFAVVVPKEYANRPEEDDYQGIPVYRLPFWTAIKSGHPEQMIKLRQRVAALKRDFAPDLIHIALVGPSVFFHMQTITGRPAPVLVDLTSDPSDQAAGSDAIVGKLLRTAAWVTCVSAATLAQTHAWMPETIPRSSVIYKGRDVSAFKPDPLPTAAPRLLCLGRLDHVKGFDLAVSAFGSVLTHVPGARLVIAGDGPERQRLERQIADLGLQTRVEMIGEVHPDAVPELMNTATLVLIPSRREGLPNVAKEAGLMARPVVATEVGGLPEILVHPHTGLLIKPEDPTALAEAIVFLLQRPEVASQMGQAAQRRVREVFGFDRYVNASDTIYRQLIPSAKEPITAPKDASQQRIDGCA